MLLGKNVLGKGNGLMLLSSGPVGLLAVPMANFAVKRRGGNLFVPNVINTALIAPAFLIAYIVGLTIRREEEEKSKQTVKKETKHVSICA